MSKKKQETLLPERKARAEPYKRFRALPPAERHEAVMQWNEELRTHPDFAAKQRIEEYLQAAHLHPDLKQSPELSNLVFLFRELLADFVPGETAEQALEPLQTLLARHGGGRRPTVDHEHVRRYHARLKANGDHDATSQTAVEFGITPRAVSNILKG